jgi:Holliday junction resolvase RusA-like endonuclease
VSDLFKITIPGRPRILKNSKKIGRNRFSGKIYVGKSDRYERWAFHMKTFFYRSYKGEAIDFPINIAFKFYFKDHAHEPDLSNAYQGLEDLLQLSGVIKNDKLIYSHDGSRKIFGDKNERIEITITRFEE